MQLTYWRDMPMSLRVTLNLHQSCGNKDTQHALPAMQICQCLMSVVGGEVDNVQQAVARIG